MVEVHTERGKDLVLVFSEHAPHFMARVQWRTDRAELWWDALFSFFLEVKTFRPLLDADPTFFSLENVLASNRVKRQPPLSLLSLLE